MSMLIVKKENQPDEELRLVYAEVYAPNTPDSVGDFMSVDEVRKAAHDFVRKGRLTQVDTNHDNKLVEGVQIVESFIAREGDQMFIPHSWVIGVHVPDDATWSAIKKGEINGFSLEALAKVEDKTVEVEIPPVVSGRTSVEADHEHQFYVAYDDAGKFLGGQTSDAGGHKHLIKRGTTTEEVNGHTHRFSAVDGVRVHP